MARKPVKDTKSGIIPVDPEYKLSKASLRPDELTIDDIKGSVVRLADGEVFWKIPNSTFILSRFDSQYASTKIESTMSYFEYIAILDGLKFGKLQLTDETTGADKNTGIKMMVMNPDQWSISAYRLIDHKDIDYISDLIADEDNLLTLERALEIETTEHKRERILDLLRARITAVKNA